MHSSSAMGISLSDTSRPSARRRDMSSSSSSVGRPAVRRPSTMRRASRLNDTSWPVRASNTTTPTGEVSTSASRSARARSSAAVGARVGDRGRGLRREKHQDLFVLVGKRPTALLLDEIEVADMHPPVAHGHALEGPPRQSVGREAERAHMVRHIGDPDRPVQVAEMLEQPGSVRPLRNSPVLLGGEARGEEIDRLSGLVDGGDRAIARAGERPGAVDHLLEHGLEIEARADTQ